MNIPSGNVTFLFTDIEGSTRLAQEFPESLPLALEKHYSILQTAIESNNGCILKTAGDAFYCSFEKSADAVKAAVDAQISLTIEKCLPEGDNALIKVRMGIHSGPAEWNGRSDVGYITLARTARVMSAAYGGQIIISGAAYELYSEQNSAGSNEKISFRDLGERRLKDLIQPLRLYQVIASGIREVFPPLKTLDARPNNLPLQLTSFIGLEKEIEQIKYLMKQTRLLTFTGPGGTGKTRLALQIAADLIDDFENGVWFVDLASLSEPEFITNAIMQALDIKEQPKRKIEDTLSDYLKEKELLIIFDNCEHLVKACAKLSEKLLQSSPKLKILATSREALQCLGEQIYQTLPLPVPDIKSMKTIEDFSQYESVRLFNERAFAINSNFRMTADNAKFVAEICAKLDGIPLAIEMAAARIKILSVEEIYKRLNDGFRLLTGGKRTALPRQQTLKALIDWSYDLLNQEERILWKRLSVFTGGWTLEAAEEICSDNKIKNSEIVDLLSQLIEKSIVIFDEINNRYKMLMTIKQYGEEKLNLTNESSEVFLKYLDYFTRLSESAQPKFEQSEGPLWLEKIENDHGNFQSAIELSMKVSDKEKGLPRPPCRDAGEAGARIAIALKRFWIIRGHYSTGRQLLKKILNSQDGLSKSTIGMVYSSIGSLSILQVGYEEARNFFEKGISIQREIDDKPGIAYSLNGLGYVSLYTGKFEEAQKNFNESLEMYREIGNKSSIAKILNNLGNLEISLGKLEQAKKFYEESLTIVRESGNKMLVSHPLNNLGAIANDEGNYELAKKYFQESLVIAREKENKSGIANTLYNLGMAECKMGNNDEAINLLEECRTLYNAIGDKSGIALSLYGFGIAAITIENFKHAENYFKECLSLKQEIGEKMDVPECFNFLGVLSFLDSNIEVAQKNIEMSLDVSRELKDTDAITVSVIVFSGILSAQNKLIEAAKLLGAVERSLQPDRWALDSVIERFEEKIIKDLRESLSVEVFDKYFEEGKKLTLDQATELALSSIK